jgi:MscS family membrane protein
MAAPTREITSVLEKLPLGSLGSENDLRAWLVLLLATAAGLVAGRLTTWALRRLAERNAAGGRAGRAQIIRGLAGPASLALLALGLNFGVASPWMSPSVYDFALKPLRFLLLVVVYWYAYNLVDVIAVAVRLRHGGDPALSHQILLLVSRSLRLLLVVMATLSVARSVFDQDISTWLAGLGIAGLAVSLAAQDSLKQFFGSIAILLDHSFRIGDEVISCGYDGTIEDIGFRSTKVRTAAGHLVTIPNANLVNNPIENVSRRPAARRVVTLLVAGQTPWEKLRDVLRALEGIFEQEGIRGPVRPVIDHVACPPQARFEDIQAGDFRLTVTYWYAPATDPDYAAHAERVNLQIVAELQKAGVELVQPVR